MNAATIATRARYNRIARFYDLLKSLPERTFKPWREKLWSYARGNILEVGVGTGKNFPYHPRGAHVTGIDLADQMLARGNTLVNWARRLICGKETCRRSSSPTIHSIQRWRRLSSAPCRIQSPVYVS